MQSERQDTENSRRQGYAQTTKNLQPTRDRGSGRVDLGRPGFGRLHAGAGGEVRDLRARRDCAVDVASRAHGEREGNLVTMSAAALVQESRGGRWTAWSRPRLRRQGCKLAVQVQLTCGELSAQDVGLSAVNLSAHQTFEVEGIAAVPSRARTTRIGRDSQVWDVGLSRQHKGGIGGTCESIAVASIDVRLGGATRRWDLADVLSVPRVFARPRSTLDSALGAHVYGVGLARAEHLCAQGG
ncbi:hypothetical protein B0H10DRAFT_2251284 [Mycena sp. CBHHK59/15]|nr:hypothetical protein B0H10DRAFT_2251284 [Mycena sp. CBHHK59/15]